MDLPECPVCLQTYNDHCTIPRVLSCGHSACEACLIQLPQCYPYTIRCPACTQLVKFPTQQGPSALPKNIDVLRISLQHSSPSSSDNKSQKPKNPSTDYYGCDHTEFAPQFWLDDFYPTWKDWVLPHGLVSVGPGAECDEEPGLCTLLGGKLGSSTSSNGRVWFKDDHPVSLAPVVSLPSVLECNFKLSYVAQIMRCLKEMREDERKELGFIVGISTRLTRMSRVYGLWTDTVQGHLYLVCERHKKTLSQKFDVVRDGFCSVRGSDFRMDGICGFSLVGMNVCDALISLQSEGLVVGCLGSSCFCFDELGGIHIDLNEALVMGRKVRRIIEDAVSGCKKNDDKRVSDSFRYSLMNDCFVSPEVLFELLHKKDTTPDGMCLKYTVGFSSDVWSLSCLLLQLLIGHALPLPELSDGSDFLAWYSSWIKEVNSLLDLAFSSECLSLRQMLGKCLDINPVNRPDLIDVRKCIRELLIKPQFDMLGSFVDAVNRETPNHCLFLGVLCQLPEERSISQGEDEFSGGENDSPADSNQVGHETVGKDFIEGLSMGAIECKDLRGHLDCITGLAVGGGYLFSSSFDKSIHLWSLQDFAHVHTFRGHEHKVMALVYMDEELPLCISGDSGGGIFVWDIIAPLGTDPFRKWYEQKDWRFSGIHAMAVSKQRYVYTGSGDRSIKAWSLLDSTLVCTMNGHKSVVSTLALFEEVLYSGSWDGTVRLWSLLDHSPLTILGEEKPGEITSVLSIAACRNMFVAAQENGSVKVWRNDVFTNSKALHSGPICALSMQERLLYTGGWDKTIYVHELTGDELQMEVLEIGSIPCNSVITALLCWKGKLFVGYADKSVKVYFCGKQ